MSDFALPPHRGQILKDLVELRKRVGGLAAKQRQGVMYKVKDARELMEKLRDAGDELGMPMVGAVVDSTSYDVAGFETWNNKANKMVPQLVTHTTVTVRFMSNDGSYVDFKGSGHGSSNDDKAGGKASTYAWKDAVVKGLSLPDKDMKDTDDESTPMERGATKPKFNFKKGS